MKERLEVVGGLLTLKEIHMFRCDQCVSFYQLLYTKLVHLYMFLFLSFSLCLYMYCIDYDRLIDGEHLD